MKQRFVRLALQISAVVFASAAGYAIVDEGSWWKSILMNVISFLLIDAYATLKHKDQQ